MHLAKKLPESKDVDHDKAKKVIMDVFGHVLICRDRKVASNLSKDISLKVDCITTDGDYVMKFTFST